MKKLLGLTAAALVAFGMFAGCNNPLDNGDTANVELAIDSLALTAGAAIGESVIYAWDCSDVPTLAVVVTNAAGVDKTTSFDISGLTQPTVKKDGEDGSISFEIKAKSTAASGAYTFKMTATVGSKESVVSCPVTVTGGTVIPTDTTLTEKVLTLGSWQNATLGSSLEADSMVVMGATAAAAASANVDLWFSNLGDGTANLFSPSSAAAALYSPKNWTTKNTTVIVKVTGQTWANITTQTQVNTIAAAALSSATTQRLVISAGNIIALKTNNNNYRLIYITSAEGTNAGTASIKALVK